MSTPAWRRPWFLPTLLTLLLVALLATSAALWIGRDDTVDRDDSVGAPAGASLGMLVAAKQGAIAFFSLDYRHVQKDVDAVIALSTGDFKTEYSAKSPEIVASIVKQKLITVGTVRDHGAAVEFAYRDQGQVLVSVDVAKTQGTKSAPLQRNRARVTLTRVGDTWLISDIKQVR